MWTHFLKKEVCSSSIHVPVLGLGILNCPLLHHRRLHCFGKRQKQRALDKAYVGLVISVFQPQYSAAWDRTQ